MKKMRNTRTGEISYIDPVDFADAKKYGLKLIPKYKLVKNQSEVIEELEEVK